MVRNYKRKSDRQNWSSDDLKNAIEQVLSGAMGYKKAAQTYKVPQSTLEDRIQKKKKKNGLSLEEVMVGLNALVISAQIGHMRDVRDGLRRKWMILSVKAVNNEKYTISGLAPLAIRFCPYPWGRTVFCKV